MQPPNNAAVSSVDDKTVPTQSKWTNQTYIAAMDGAVIGHTLGFHIGAFPGICLGAASGGLVGAFAGGLMLPAWRQHVVCCTGKDQVVAKVDRAPENATGEGTPLSWDKECQGVLELAMIRARDAGGVGAMAGADLGGTLVGMAVAFPAAALGSLVGGAVGVVEDIRRYLNPTKAEPAGSLAPEAVGASPERMVAAAAASAAPAASPVFTGNA